MVGTEQDRIGPPSGDKILDVTDHDSENNTELVVLPKEGDNKSDHLGAEVSENGNITLPESSSSDKTHIRSIEHTNNTCVNEMEITGPHQTNVISDSHQTTISTHDTKDKYRGNSYVVTTENDDRNAQCITMYRGEVIDVSDDSDSSDSETSLTVSNDNENSDNTSTRSSSDESDIENEKTSRVIQTKGDLTIQNLPPIEDLKISVDENKCKPVGSVLNIVDEMVVIQSFPHTPPLDINTVLFLDRGQRALGKIFDIFGAMQEPLYSVRFNSREHVQEKNIRREQVVYCALQTEHTSYVDVSQLLREKGSDVPWTHNNEPSETCLDFLEDELEARHKWSKGNTGSIRNTPSENDVFVKKMNQKNLELTAKRKKEDEAKQKRGSVLRKEMTCPGSHAGERLMSASAHSFTPFSRSRTFGHSNNGIQACSTSFFHHPASSAIIVNTHSSPPLKFESGSALRSVNYLRNAAVSCTPPPPLPLNYTFSSPQHFMCSSPRQLPNLPPSSSTATPAAPAHNYFAMCHNQQTPTGPTACTTVLPMVPPQFSTFTAASIPPMPTFMTQPQPKPYQAQPQQQRALHPAMPPSFNTFVSPPPPSFYCFNPMPTSPLPSSLPQPNFFATRTDVGNAKVYHPATFIPLNMRPAVPPYFHPQFILPLPPHPPPLSVTLTQSQPQQQYQRNVSTGSRMPDRRIQQQSSHRANNTFYSTSSTNS